MDNTLRSLEQAIMAKQGPLATCQAKIHQRRLRPGSEYCHDEVDDQLAREQRNLLDLINKLEGGLGQVSLTSLDIQPPSYSVTSHYRRGNVTASYRRLCWSWRTKLTRSATAFLSTK